MKGVTPLRKMLVLLVFVVVTGLVYTKYYSKALQEFEIFQGQRENQAELIASKKTQILAIQEARAAAESTIELRDQLRTRLTATPPMLKVVRQLELDLAEMGYPAPTFNPHRSSDRQAEGTRVRVDGFGLVFECRFQDLLELLRRWEELPYGIRIADFTVSPSHSDTLLVRLTLQLHKVLSGSES